MKQKYDFSKLQEFACLPIEIMFLCEFFLLKLLLLKHSPVMIIVSLAQNIYFMLMCLISHAHSFKYSWA